MKIYIDQGHNPVNPNAGAEAFGYREQDITYKVGVMLAGLLESNPFFQVKLSRKTPTTQLGTSNTTSLKARVDEANEWGANYFISIHANASTNSQASGSEAYVYREHSYAYYMAEQILIGLNKATGLNNRGIFINKSFYVLKNTKMPAILVELGYMTNQFDIIMMVEYPELFAQGMYDGILSYFGLDK